MIRISSTATQEDNEPERMEFIVTGTLTIGKMLASLVYDEMLEEQVEHVNMEIRNDMLFVNRSGEFSSQMAFGMGVRSEGFYHTPFGDLEMATYCTNLAYDVTEEGGDIQFSYQLDINGRFASVHQIEMKLTRQND